MRESIHRLSALHLTLRDDFSPSAVRNASISPAAIFRRTVSGLSCTDGNALGFVALSLKTTRSDAIDLSLYRQRSNKLRLPRGTRKKKEQVLRPTNVFDMFYRYRRIAHYGKADVFTAFQTEDDGILFGETLLAVVDAACWTLETKLHERVGSALMISWYDAYMAQHDIVAGEGPVGRRFSDLVAPF